MGIGTIDPKANLHISIPGSGSPINAIALDVGSFGTIQNAFSSSFFVCKDVGSGKTQFAINGAGWVGVGTDAPQTPLDVRGTTQTGALTITGGSDIAEPFEMSAKEIPKGTVVVIDDSNPGHLTMSSRAYDTRVAGIISGANGVNPGISLRQLDVMDAGENVALSGRVYAFADTTNGQIKPGDLLTTSEVPATQ